MLNVDHDVSKVLARSKFGKGSLRCFITERGLEFETEAPNTTLGNDMLEMLKRGDYSQCSFCFSLPSDDEGFWHRNEAGELVREISKFDRLYDVSIVYDPAYDATEVDARSRAVVSAFTHLDLLEKEINSIKFYDK
jgi:HK97 family phage prohead protease